MKIGRLEIPGQTVLAPLAGITNLPFRIIVKDCGCALICAEMVSAAGLYYNGAKTVKMLEHDPAEHPISMQFFGASPAMAANAAKMIAAAGADIVDINFGCSVRKVLKTGSGSNLMREPQLAADIIKAARAAIPHKPLTIKIRSGWEPGGRQAVAIARMAEDLGVDAIAVHPRTAQQLFEGQADWNVIGMVKQAVKIPVIGNGDIKCAEDALHMISETGCDGVMVGRHAVDNPWIFAQINALLAGRPPYEPTLDDRFAMMRLYLTQSVKYLGEKTACHLMRGRLGWFVKGMPGNTRFKESIKLASQETEILDKIAEYENSLPLL